MLEQYSTRTRQRHATEPVLDGVDTHPHWQQKQHTAETQLLASIAAFSPELAAGVTIPLTHPNAAAVLRAVAALTHTPLPSALRGRGPPRDAQRHVHFDTRPPRRRNVPPLGDWSDIIIDDSKDDDEIYKHTPSRDWDEERGVSVAFLELFWYQRVFAGVDAAEWAVIRQEEVERAARWQLYQPRRQAILRGEAGAYVGEREEPPEAQWEWPPQGLSAPLALAAPGSAASAEQQQALDEVQPPQEQMASPPVEHEAHAHRLRGRCDVRCASERAAERAPSPSPKGHRHRPRWRDPSPHVWRTRAFEQERREEDTTARSAASGEAAGLASAAGVEPAERDRDYRVRASAEQDEAVARAERCMRRAVRRDHFLHNGNGRLGGEAVGVLAMEDTLFQRGARGEAPGTAAATGVMSQPDSRVVAKAACFSDEGTHGRLGATTPSRARPGPHDPHVARAEGAPRIGDATTVRWDARPGEVSGGGLRGGAEGAEAERKAERHMAAEDSVGRLRDKPPPQPAASAAEARAVQGDTQRPASRPARPRTRRLSGERVRAAVFGSELLGLHSCVEEAEARGVSAALPSGRALDRTDAAWRAAEVFGDVGDELESTAGARGGPKASPARQGETITVESDQVENIPRAAVDGAESPTTADLEATTRVAAIARAQALMFAPAVVATGSRRRRLNVLPPAHAGSLHDPSSPHVTMIDDLEEDFDSRQRAGLHAAALREADATRARESVTEYSPGASAELDPDEWGWGRVSPTERVVDGMTARDLVWGELGGGEGAAGSVSPAEDDWAVAEGERRMPGRASLHREDVALRPFARLRMGRAELEQLSSPRSLLIARARRDAAERQTENQQGRIRPDRSQSFGRGIAKDVPKQRIHMVDEKDE